MSGHSLLSPSGAHRWMVCAAAPAVAAKLPEQRTSQDAALGTCKHATSEHCLTHDIPSAGGLLGQQVEADGFKFKIDDDYVKHVDSYLEAVRREPGQKFYEITLDTSYVLNVHGQQGTADCIALDYENETLTVIDAKFGFHQVNAQDNPQGLIYIAAARRRYDMLADWKKFRFIIVQPRIDHYDEATYTLEELIEWEKKIEAAARKAAFVTQVQPHLIESYKTYDPHACEWCPIRQNCTTRINGIGKMFSPVNTLPQEPQSVSNDELSRYHKLIDSIRQWCTDIEQEAYQRAMAGQEIPGYKLIDGRKGDRYFPDPPAAEAALIELGLPKEELYEKPAMKTPTAIEKVLKERKLATDDVKAGGKLVHQGDGKPRLVESSARGKPYIVKKAEFAPSIESLV